MARSAYTFPLALTLLLAACNEEAVTDAPETITAHKSALVELATPQLGDPMAETDPGTPAHEQVGRPVKGAPPPAIQPRSPRPAVEETAESDRAPKDKQPRALGQPRPIDAETAARYERYRSWRARLEPELRDLPAKEREQRIAKLKSDVVLDGR